MRYVRTEQTSEGTQVGGAGVHPNPFGNYTPLSVERTYDECCRSLNFAYDLTDQMVLRLAAARVMARPDFTDVAPRVGAEHRRADRHGGNPDLDPYRANQADLSLEWYQQP